MVLFISNGHGEDLIASFIIKEFLKESKGVEVQALPLVGKGGAYQGLGVNILGEQRVLPSGGFARQSFSAFLHDMREGLLSLTKRQVFLLRSLRGKVELGVVVGDIFPLLLSTLFLKGPLIFLPTAKSQYIHGHGPLEMIVMKYGASLVFPRDERTAHWLRGKGISASFLGNVMMDAYCIRNYSFGVPKGEKILGILPGSREEAFLNLKSILPSLTMLKDMGVKVVPILALAPSLSLKNLRERLPAPFTLHHGVGEGIAARIKGEGVEVLISTEGFGDLLHQATLFIGLSGTANEQAAGMGKVVVAFPGEGPQFGPSFLRAQKRLLGDALLVVERDPKALAEEIKRLLLHEGERLVRGRVGQERMGPPGGASSMAQEILTFRANLKEEGGAL